MKYRRTLLLAGIASLALVAGAGLTAAQEPAKEKASPAKPPQAATQPMNKAPAAAEKAPSGQRAEEMNREKAPQKTMAEPKTGAQGEPAKRAEENERMNKPGNGRAEENEHMNKPAKGRAEENEHMNKPGNAAAEGNKSDTQKQDATAQRGNESKSAKSSAAANVKLTSDQRARIKSTVLSANGAPRVTNVNFDVRIGTVVPRGGVEYVAVPETLVTIEPAWRGFLYFVYGEEIVIIDPDSMAIVAVVAV